MEPTEIQNAPDKEIVPDKRPARKRFEPSRSADGKDACPEPPFGDIPTFRPYALSEPEDKTAAEEEVYRALGILTHKREQWEDAIPKIAALLSFPSVKIQAKALWLLGEAGLAFPASIQPFVPAIAEFCDHTEPLLRQRAVNALGRIGRGSFALAEPYWESLFRFASDDAALVRHSFLWASENIAMNTPDPYAGFMHIYAQLLSDPDDKVRMEAPEMFRVLAKQRPLYVQPYMELLQTVSVTDQNRVVRIHCKGALKAAGYKEQRNDPGIPPKAGEKR